MEITQQDLERVTSDFITMVSRLGLDATAEAAQLEGRIHINVRTPDPGRLIGRRGKTLAAIQLLLNGMARRDKENFPRVFIDIDGYRSEGKGRFEHPGTEEGDAEGETDDTSNEDDGEAKTNGHAAMNGHNGSPEGGSPKGRPQSRGPRHQAAPAPAAASGVDADDDDAADAEGGENGEGEAGGEVDGEGRQKRRRRSRRGGRRQRNRNNHAAAMAGGEASAEGDDATASAADADGESQGDDGTQGLEVADANTADGGDGADAANANRDERGPRGRSRGGRRRGRDRGERGGEPAAARPDVPATALSSERPDRPERQASSRAPRQERAERPERSVDLRQDRGGDRQERTRSSDEFDARRSADHSRTHLPSELMPSMNTLTDEPRRVELRPEPLNETERLHRMASDIAKEVHMWGEEKMLPPLTDEQCQEILVSLKDHPHVEGQLGPKINDGRTRIVVREKH